VNASEPLMRLRQPLTAETMADHGSTGNEKHGSDVAMIENDLLSLSRYKTPQPRSKGGTHPSRISVVWNVVTPMESGGGRYTGKPTARKAKPSSGNRTVQEAKASSRKAPGIHNRLDRAIPHLKRC
jgi:hypothetical protein